MYLRLYSSNWRYQASGIGSHSCTGGGICIQKEWVQVRRDGIYSEKPPNFPLISFSTTPILENCRKGK